MAVKITAALNGIQLSSGRTVSFDDIEKYDKQINEQAHRDRCFAFSKNGNDVYVTWGMGHLCELKQAADYDRDVLCGNLPHRVHLEHGRRSHLLPHRLSGCHHVGRESPAIHHLTDDCCLVQLCNSNRLTNPHACLWPRWLPLCRLSEDWHPDEFHHPCRQPTHRQSPLFTITQFATEDYRLKAQQLATPLAKYIRH